MRFPSCFRSPASLRQAGALCLLCLIGLILYFNALKGEFQFDDRRLLAREWIADLETVSRQVDPWAIQNRPVLLWTFALNNTWAPNEVFGFHLLNLGLHLAVVALVFAIGLKTQRWLEPDGRPPALTGPFLAALVFAVHPLNTDSVSYVSSRSTLLAAFFFLLALYGFLSLFDAAGGRWRGLKRCGTGLLTLVAAVLALGSKLTAVSLPGICALWFFAFIVPRRFPSLGARLADRRNLPVYLGLGAAAAVALYAVSPWLYTPRDQGLVLYGRLPYLLVQLKVIVFYYLKLFFVPINLNVDPGFPFSRLAEDPGILVAAAVILGLGVWGFRARSPWPAVGFLGFLLTLAPTSSFVPLNDLAVEHRTYLPLALGLCLAAGWGLGRLRPTLRTAVLVVLVVSLSGLTAARNGVWTTELALWQDAVRKNPRSPRTHNNLGKAYYERGHWEPAVRHFEKSVAAIPQYVRTQYNIDAPAEWLARQAERKPRSPLPTSAEGLGIAADLVEPHYNLASVYLDVGRWPDARREYETAIRLRPGHFEAHLGLGSVYARMGRIQEAERAYRNAIEARRRAPGQDDYALARLNLGELYGKAGRLAEAIEELQRAIQLDPARVPAHYNLGLAHLKAGHLDRADHALRRALDLDPRFLPARFQLARVYQQKSEWQKSIRQFEKFLELKGPDPVAYAEIGFNHQQLGNWEAARNHYEHSLELRPGHLGVRMNLGILYLRSRQPQAARTQFEEALALNPPPEQAQRIQQWIRRLSRL